MLISTSFRGPLSDEYKNGFETFSNWEQNLIFYLYFTNEEKENFIKKLFIARLLII